MLRIDVFWPVLRSCVSCAVSPSICVQLLILSERFLQNDGLISFTII